MLTEKVMLPSQGLIYDLDEPCREISVRAFSTRDFKDFLSKGPSEGVDTLLKACMVDSPIKAEDLYYSDSLVLLLKIRAMTLGYTLPATDTCPNCNHVNEHEWNLSELPVKYLSVSSYPFKVTLPESKEVILLRLPTPKVLERAEAAIKSRVTKFNLKRADLEADYLAAASIQLEGINDIVTVVEWFKKLSLKDSMYVDFLRTKINDFGVRMDSKITCADCGKEFLTLFVSRSSSFFRIQFDSPDWFATEEGTLETGINAAVLPE